MVRTGSPVQSRPSAPESYSNATLAQMVEHSFRKAGVPSSNLGGGSDGKRRYREKNYPAGRDDGKD